MRSAAFQVEPTPSNACSRPLVAKTEGGVGIDQEDGSTEERVAKVLDEA
jgi:hypothetical protein